MFEEIRVGALNLRKLSSWLKELGRGLHAHPRRQTFTDDALLLEIVVHQKI